MSITLRGHIIATILAGFLCYSSHSAYIAASNSSVPQRKIVEISSIDDHCVKNICRDFHFDNLTEFAVFDLKAKVRISEEQPPTYELSSPVEYDTLIFENSTFANFPIHFFYSLWVKELDMRNCSVEHLTWENFLMASELRNLLLSENKLDRIEEMTFYYATKLQFLFLDSNRIRSLVSESFKGLTELRFLDLHKNRLEELPEGVFDHCPNLQELNLAENRLHVLKANAFSGIPNILTLILHQNRLRDINEFAFKEQRRLMLLDVSQNSHLETLIVNLNAQYLVASNCSLYRVNIYGKVNSVDLRHNRILELYFSQPQDLESLDLRNNALQQISSLARATKLRSLDLGDNPELGCLPDPWTVQSLERLDLSNTGMTELPMSSLTSSGQLRFLNISGNHIREINPRNFRALENLTHIYIHANEWNCFNLKMLMDLLITPNKMYYNHDTFSADFPGEYINGIACMYRLPNPNEEEDIKLPQSQNYIVLSETSQNNDSLEEVRNLRKELKSIVSFYEEKFSKAFSMILDLQKRIHEFEKLNETMWQHITVTT